MNRSNLWLLSLALFFAVANTGCGTGEAAVNHNEPPAPVAAATPARLPLAPLTVEVLEVKPAAAGEELIPAVLSTEATATVLAQRDGMLIELRGQEGTLVKKGEPLARLSADDMHTQLEQAQLEVARLTVEERQHEALVKLNQTELNQETELFKDGLTSKRQLERAQNKLEGSVQELEKLRLATQTARSRVEAVQIESEKCVIRAPFTGVVTHRFAKLGATITRNDKLFEVAQLSQLEVKIQVPQSAQTQLSPGCLLKLSLSDDERIVAQARITRLDPIVDVLSNTRGYWAAVSGGKGLVPGLAVLVHLPHMAHAGVATTLSVPRAAFPAASGLRPDTPQVLFVVDSDHAQSRVVQVQAIVGEQVEIKSGLNIGERVILTPPAELKAGDLVRIR